MVMRVCCWVCNAYDGRRPFFSFFFFNFQIFLGIDNAGKLP